VAKLKSNEMVIRSDHHLSPVAKVTVLAHSMETVAYNLAEMAGLCEKLGEDALGREARVIADAMTQRRHAFLILSRQAGKTMLMEAIKPEIKSYGSKKDKKAKGSRRRLH
jgi:hypothetical protein